VLLPGALLVTGLSELAAGAMVAGSSRLLYGTVQLLLFALGIAAAAALLHTPTELLGNVRVAGLGWWAAPLGLIVIGLGIALMESVPVRLAPWVLAVLVVTFLAQLAGQHLGSPALGSFLGAIAASLGASTAELLRRELPRLVVFLPSFWLLVPGSLGLIGVSEFAIAGDQGPTVGLNVLAVILAIATGLLVGSVVSRTVRVLDRRLRRVRH
ncbi:MAG TPA: threonine/serine exporter family protein, partial [Pseudonocardia sp.]|nr:threonine/serine exporter family protein [Pseudonocardia sp.]